MRRNAFLYPKQFEDVDRCFSLAACEVGPVDEFDDGLFLVGHHDRVAEDIERAEAEELSLDRIDDADIGVPADHDPTVCRRARSALSRNSLPGMLTVSCQLSW